jgi:hypothetical protein
VRNGEGAHRGERDGFAAREKRPVEVRLRHLTCELVEQPARTCCPGKLHVLVAAYEVR